MNLDHATGIFGHERELEVLLLFHGHGKRLGRRLDFEPGSKYTYFVFAFQGRVVHHMHGQGKVG